MTTPPNQFFKLPSKTKKKNFLPPKIKTLQNKKVSSSMKMVRKCLMEA